MAKHSRQIAALTLLLLTLFIAYTGWDVYRFARLDQTRSADAAIVLGAAAFGSEPSPVLRERVNQAIALYENGFVQYIIFTGAQGPTGTASEAQVAADYAGKQGIPANVMLLDEMSHDTEENLANAQQLGDNLGLDSYLLVSTPFHMRRATVIATKLGLDAKSSPTRTIVWISWYTKSRAYMQEVASYSLFLLQNIFT